MAKKRKDHKALAVWDCLLLTALPIFIVSCCGQVKS